MTGTPPVELGSRSSPRYRVAPTVRFQRAWETLSDQPTIRAVAPRRTADATAPATVDLRAVLEIRELKFPGRAGNAQLVRNKWVYLFNIDQRTCVLEGLGTVEEVGGRSQQVWRCRTGSITPSGQREESPSLPIESRETIDFQTVAGAPGDTWGVFLTSIRLSQQGLQYLIDCLAQSQGRTDDGCPVTKIRWVTTARAAAWVPDPWIWAEDALVEFEEPRLAHLLAWHADSERQAKLFVASTLKGMIDNGVDQISNNLNSGQPDTFLNTEQREQERRSRQAEEAAGYVSECVDAPEHRAIELSAHQWEHSDSVSHALQHWALVLSGKMNTQNGRAFLRLTLERGDRTPAKYIFTDSPPRNTPGWGDARYAYIAARQIATALLPAWVNWKKAQAQEPYDQIQRKVGEYIERLYRQGGRRSVNWRQRAIRRELAAGAPVGSSRPMGQRRRVEREYRQILLAIGEDVPADPRRVTQSLDTRWGGWEARMGRLNRYLAPMQALAEVYNLTMGLNAWRDAAADEPQISFFGVASVRSSTVGAVGAAADFGAWVAEVMALFGRITESTASRVAGPLAIVSGTTEMLAHGQNAINSAYGQNNIAAASASGVAAFGGALGAIGGAMALAAHFGLASASFGHIGIIVGIIGGILIFVGALVAALLSRDAFENFAEHCFLGDSAGESSGYDHRWSPINPLPHGVEDQARVILHLLAAFQIRKDATVSVPVTAWSNPNSHRFNAEIRLGYFPQGAELQIEVEMEFGWVQARPGAGRQAFRSVLRLSPQDSNVRALTDDSTLIVDTPAVERDSDGHPRRLPLNLCPRAIKVNGNWTTLDTATMQSCQWIVVRAKLVSPGRPNDLNVPPYAEGWCEARIHGDGAVDAAHTLDSSFFRVVNR